MKYLNENGEEISSRYDLPREIKNDEWKDYKLNDIFGKRGIYILKKGKLIVYIGQSRQCIMSRIFQHKNDENKIFDNFRTMIVNNPSNTYLNNLERDMIRKYQPKYNVIHTRKNRDQRKQDKIENERLKKVEHNSKYPMNLKVVRKKSKKVKIEEIAERLKSEKERRGYYGR